MNEIDFIFNNNQYNKLKQEYDKFLNPKTEFCISALTSIINKLHINSFQLPLNLQNQILDKLLRAQEILNIIHLTHPSSQIKFLNNPFNLIYNLITLSIQLNSYSFKSPYQILYLKSNDLISQSIQQISNYFMNKKY